MNSPNGSIATPHLTGCALSRLWNHGAHGLTAVSTNTGVCWALQEMDGGLVVVCGMGVCKDAPKG